MSDNQCAHIGCTRPSHRFWRLCDEHGPEYSDVVERIMRASTPTPEMHVYRGPAPALSTIHDHIAKIEREVLDGKTDKLREIASRGFLGPCDCGRPIYGTARDRGRRCDVCRALKPPTIREWLGDRVSELGRWAEVLRDQPVPAGCYTAWQWIGGGKSSSSTTATCAVG